MATERKFNMQQRIADGGFYAGPSFSTHQEHALLPYIKEYGVKGKDVEGNKQFHYKYSATPDDPEPGTPLLEGEEELSKKEHREMLEVSPQIKAVCDGVSRVLDRTLGFKMRFGNIAEKGKKVAEVKEDEDRLDYDLVFLSDKEMARRLRDHATQNDLFLSGLPVGVGDALFPPEQMFSEGVVVNGRRTIYASKESFLDKLSTEPRTQEDALEQRYAAMRMGRRLIQSAIKIAPEPEPTATQDRYVELTIDPGEGALAYKAAKINNATNGVFSGVLRRKAESLRGRIKEGVSLRAVLQGMGIKIGVDNGKQFQEIGMIDEMLNGHVVDHLTLRTFENFLDYAEGSSNFNPKWYLREETVEALSRNTKWRARNQQTASMLDQEEQGIIGATTVLRQNGARGESYLKSIYFPYGFSFSSLTPEDAVREQFRCFRSSMLPFYTYNAGLVVDHLLVNEPEAMVIGKFAPVLVDQMREKDLKSDPEYGTFAPK